MNQRTKSLLQENNQTEKQLSDASQQVLTDIVVYLRTAPISMYRQEIVRRDITRMLLDGEARGDNASSVIGNDYQAFCDSVIASAAAVRPHPRAGCAARCTARRGCAAADLAGRTVGRIHSRSVRLACADRDRRGCAGGCCCSPSPRLQCR